MSSLPLYLFKAARRPLHLKENLNILSTERGSVIEVAYNQMWVAPDLLAPGSIEPGTITYFVYSDRPYSLFVPVRQGEIVDAAWDDTLLRLRILIHSWIGVEDRDLGDFTALVKDASRNRAPGGQATKFVLPKLDDAPLISYFDQREDEGWHRAIDNVLAMSRTNSEAPYRASVFFRPLGVRVDGELHPARRLPLDPGATGSLALRFHNPHLAQGAITGLELQVLASDDVVAHPPGAFPLLGDVEIPFEVTGDDPELTVRIGPTPAAHTVVTQRLLVRGKAGHAPAREATTGALSRAELLALFDVVWRNAHFEPGDDLDVLDAFEHLLPGEARIAERRALLLAARGKDDEAWTTLRGLDPEELGDPARRLLFRLSLLRESVESALQRVAALGLTTQGRFDAFLDTLAELDDAPLGHLLPRLAYDVTPDQLTKLVDRLGERVDSVDTAVEIAQAIYLVKGDAGWAYSYLRDRARSLHADSPRLTAALLELASAGAPVGADDELFDDAARAITNLIAQDRIEEARGWLVKATDAISRAEQDRLYHRIADRFLDKGRHDEAIAILVEHADRACAHGDLADATEAIQRARGIWASSPAGRSGEPVPTWLEDSIGRVQAAWEECADLVEWRKSDDTRTAERLRARYLNRRILIAGGIRKQEWLERIQELTGARVDWATAYRDETDDLDAYAERIRNRHYDAVVHYWQKTGHELGDRIRPACEEAGVPWLQSTSAGLRGILEALSQG